MQPSWSKGEFFAVQVWLYHRKAFVLPSSLYIFMIWALPKNSEFKLRIGKNFDRTCVWFPCLDDAATRHLRSKFIDISRMSDRQAESCRLCIGNKRSQKTSNITFRRYNGPSASEVEAILPGPENGGVTGGVIILHRRADLLITGNKSFYRILNSRRSYAPLSYPQFYPYDQDGCHFQRLFVLLPTYIGSNRYIQQQMNDIL